MCFTNSILAKKMYRNDKLISIYCCNCFHQAKFLNCATIFLLGNCPFAKSTTHKCNIDELHHCNWISSNSSSLPDHEVGQLLLALHGDPHPAVHLLPVLGGRPVLDTHHPDEVEGPGDHHDAAGLLLPGHPPEVRHGGLRGALGHDVGLGLHQALHDKS